MCNTNWAPVGLGDEGELGVLICISIAVISYMFKNQQLEKGKMYHLIAYILLPRRAGARTQSRDLKTGNEEEIVEECCLLACFL